MLKTKVCRGAEAEAGDVGMLEIGVAFDEVESQHGEDVVDADAGFHVGLAAQCIGGSNPFCQGEFQLVGILIRVIDIPQTAVEDLATDDFPQSPFL